MIAPQYATGYSLRIRLWATQFNSLLNTGYYFVAQIPSWTTISFASPINNVPAANGFSDRIPFQGDPVNMLTGNLYHNERDISLKSRGGLPIVFERSYNSRAPKDGPLGYGWTHSFNHYIRFYGVENGVAKFSWTDGSGGEKFYSTSTHTDGNLPCSDSVAIPRPAGVYQYFRRATNCEY